jgi:GNAT superfamily N-acetyltransferase
MADTIERDGPVTPGEIEALRVAVGWDASAGTYARVLPRHWAHYTARDEAGRLIAYTSVLSDGVADAFLLDLMVHPEHQQRGLGSALVRRVIADVRAAGIRALQVTFEEHLAPFYARCGFFLFGGGIIDFGAPPDAD